MVTPFESVIGHRAVLSLLEAEAARPAQAYLFVGPAGAGKATVARRFAAALLCAADDSGCIRRVLHANHPDLVPIEPDGSTALTVDQARATVARAALAPVEADRKVFLFEEAGMMNDEAANALLKTLEEPTPSTVFLLVAESEDQLPATIASRCRSVFFGRVTDAEIVAALQQRGVDAERAAHAAATSGGRPGLALMLATRPEVAAFRRTWLAVPTRLGPSPGDAYRLADEVIEASAPLLAALEDRQREELEAASDEGTLRILKDRHDRERRRASSALYATGLEILASWYRDAAAAQFGAAVRNRDVPGADLAGVAPAAAVARADRVLAAVASLEANQRVDLALADLFSDLAPAS